MKAKYNSLDFSKKVIHLTNEKGFFITNLQLQKVLYYLQGAYMKNYNKKAFDEEIECWPYGPVVKSVWKEYSVYGRAPIRGVISTLQLSQDEEDVILNVIKEKLSMYVWDLVDQTHSEFPWKTAFENGKSVISDKDMKEFFCNE